jgi:hypothetical protein
MRQEIEKGRRVAVQGEVGRRRKGRVAGCRETQGVGAKRERAWENGVSGRGCDGLLETMNFESR